MRHDAVPIDVMFLSQGTHKARDMSDKRTEDLCLEETRMVTAIFA